MIGTSAGEGRDGTGELVHAGQSVPGAPEYSVPDGFRGRVTQHHETQRQSSRTSEETARRSHRDSTATGNGRVDQNQQLIELEEAVRGRGSSNGQSSRPSFTPSGRADIPIEHEPEPEPELEATVEPEPGMEEPELMPEPMPEPEPEPEPEPAYRPLPEGPEEPIEYEDTDQVICEEDDQQQPSQPGDQDYVSPGPCGSGPSITATSSIFEHQVSMISVPIPAVMDHIANSNSKGGSFMSAHQFIQQPPMGHLQPPQMPMKGQMTPPQHMMTGSKHVSSSSSSSSYSKTYITSGVVPMSSLPANVIQPPAMPSPNIPNMSSKGSGCQSAMTYTYKCQMVYGPTKRTKICETVPAEPPANCCSVC